MSGKVQTIRVATFVRPVPYWNKLLKRHVSAYTYWYSPDWPTCKEYDIEAKSGDEAKKIAINLRLQEEREKRGEKP